jgi:hypothetical protein
MIVSQRKKYNNAFTKEKYAHYMSDLQHIFPGQLDFRVAETPLFISKDFEKKMLDACESIIDVIKTPQYKKDADAAIPPGLNVPGENEFPHCIAFDFGICSNEKNELEPQLIEMQGFPSLFCWQVFLPDTHAQHFEWPEGFSPYLNGYNRESYIQLLKNIIIGDTPPQAVVLLEILPREQKTRVDFYATQQLLGIETVCISELETENRQLYYTRNGKRQQIKKIYNRVIFDDLSQQSEAIREKGKIFQQELEVEWIPHPNWFFRLSKYTLPFIRHAYVPETKFLSSLTSLPNDLENYVVKPLFSFAGQGVIIDVTEKEVQAIKDKENWIIQKKVQYAAAIETPGEMAKAEIRLFYFWEPGKERPVAANNLCRLSKGKMVGVRYNMDKDWVGGSFCLFEQSGKF